MVQRIDDEKDTYIWTFLLFTCIKNHEKVLLLIVGNSYTDVSTEIQTQACTQSSITVVLTHLTPQKHMHLKSLLPDRKVCEVMQERLMWILDSNK